MKQLSRWRDAYLDALAAGRTLDGAAAVAGVSDNTARKCRRDSPGFAAACTAARKQGRESPAVKPLSSAGVSRGSRPSDPIAARNARAARYRPPRKERVRPHPATGEPIYRDDERQFMLALESYRLRTGVRFPTACQTLDVLKSLGYQIN